MSHEASRVRGLTAAFDRHRTLLGVLRESGDLVAEMNFRPAVLAQDIELDGRQPVLLEMQPVGVRRVGGEQFKIELGDQVARLVADLPVAHLDARLQHARGDAIGRHHVQRRRMKGARAQVARQRRFSLKQHDGNILAPQRQRAHQAGRAGSGNDDGQAIAHIVTLRA